MSDFTIEDYTYHTSGEVNAIGEKAPQFTLTASDLSLVRLSDYKDKALLLNVFPSIDTPVCFGSCQVFNQPHSQEGEVLCISKDLPFALARYEKEKKFANVRLLSDFRNHNFGHAYGLTIIDGPLAGLLAREVIVIDKYGYIVYQDFSKDITHSVNTKLALEAFNDVC